MDMKSYHSVYAMLVPSPIDGERLYRSYGIILLACPAVPRRSSTGVLGYEGPYVATLAAPAAFNLSSVYVLDALNDYYGCEVGQQRVTTCVNVGHWFEEV